MRPVDQRADEAFMQALRCVEYRLPRADGFKQEGFLLALGLRYGMVGTAAIHHLLITATDEEELRLLDLIQSWPMMVEEHARWDVLHKLEIETTMAAPHLMAKHAARCLEIYFPLYRRLVPLEQALHTVLREFQAENNPGVRAGWSLLHWRPASRNFRTNGIESVRYARHFFERRQADLEELAEIA